MGDTDATKCGKSAKSINPVIIGIIGFLICHAERDNTFTRDYKKMRMSMGERDGGGEIGGLWL